jgi:hypothetical protein
MATDLYCVVGQGTATSGTATITGSPQRLVPGANTVTVTTTATNQTFTVTMCSGTSASCASGTATVSGSPVSCPAATVTTITITNIVTNGTVTITVTYNSTANFSSAYTWASSTGGTPGAGPTSSTTNVHMDANSFTNTGQILTVDVNCSCNNMDWTGATNTPTFYGVSISYLYLYGNATFISAMVTSGITSSVFILEFMGSSTQTLNTNGLSLGCQIVTKSGSGSILSLVSNLGCQNGIAIGYGTSFLTNNYSITTYDTGQINSGIYIDDSATTVNLGSSTITIEATGGTQGWYIYHDAGGISFNAGTSTIILTGNSVFAGYNLTYNVVEFSGSAFTISGSNTFNTLSFNPSGPQTITFTDGTTQTVTNFTGTNGTNVITMVGTSTGGWYLTKSGGGVVSMDYLALSYSNASPSTLTWYAGAHSTNTVGNTGWIFTAPPVTNLGCVIPLGFVHGR